VYGTQDHRGAGTSCHHVQIRIKWWGARTHADQGEVRREQPYILGTLLLQRGSNLLAVQPSVCIAGIGKRGRMVSIDTTAAHNLIQSTNNTRTVHGQGLVGSPIL
jgi:hypothetical protein